MERDVLKGYLDEGMSLIEIGMLEGRDPSTVGYWVQKHDLIANGRARFAPRGGLRREQLEPLIDAGATLQEIATELDRSVSTVRHWLRRYGLRTKRYRWRRQQSLQARANGDTRFVSRCLRHGETEFLALPSGRSRCARCNSAAVALRRQRIKEILVEEAGGCCVLCGYDRYIGALQFHHLDPSEKAFALSGEGMTRSLERAREEAKKCVLLCANCHAEVGAGIATLPLQLVDDVVVPA